MLYRITMNRKHRINYQQVATGLSAGTMSIHSTKQAVVTGMV